MHIIKIGNIDCIKVRYIGPLFSIGNTTLVTGDTGIIPVDIWKEQAFTKYKDWVIHIIPNQEDEVFDRLTKYNND